VGRLVLGAGTGVRDRFFQAGQELLTEQGSDGLTVTALGQRLGLSSGSFQHHFGSMSRFLTELANEWEVWEYARVERCLTHRDPRRRLEELSADLLIGPGPAEIAWRAWGQTNPIAAASLRRADRNRQRALASTLSEIDDRSDADLLAECTLGMMIGLHQWFPPPIPGQAALIASEWMRRSLRLDTEVVVEAGVPRLALGAA
jgi:AcrR family transcriptional regulator